METPARETSPNFGTVPLLGVKPLPPCDSWWVGVGRDAWRETAEAQWVRMFGSHGERLVAQMGIKSLAEWM